MSHDRTIIHLDHDFDTNRVSYAGTPHLLISGMRSNMIYSIISCAVYIEYMS